MWFDNHCHLTTIKDDPAEIVSVAASEGVTKLLTVGCSVADSANAIEIASRFDNVWATAGVHPHEAANGIEGLETLLTSEEVVAVGECGLDYFYEHSPREAQAEVFAQQIALAHKYELALVIHSRDAWEDTFNVLDECGVPERTVFHCFTGTPAEAEAAAERNIYLSFSGIVTFPSAKELQAAAKVAPLNRILVETDSPYLAPVPHRGKANKPALVSVVGQFLAEHIGISVEQLAEHTTRNAHDLYGIELPAPAGG